MRLRATGVAGLIALAIAGCGNSNTVGAAASIPAPTKGPGGAPTSIVTAATVAVGGTSSHYLTATGPIIQVNGFIKTRVSASQSPTKWIQLQSLTGSYAQKQVDVMNRDGFKIAVAEDLWQKRAHISTVVQRYAAVVGPKDALALEAAHLKAMKGAKPFTVAAIPGAIGYELSGKTEIVFASGNYYVQFIRNASGQAAITQLTGVATTIYKQLAG